MSSLLNFVLYEIGWLACMAGVSAGYPQLGVGSALFLLIVHLLLHRRPRRQLLMMTVSAATGLLVDSLLIMVGILRFPHAGPLPYLPPLWMTVLWAQFAMTFPGCLRWMYHRPAITATLTFVSVPFIFLSGQRMGVVSLPPSPIVALGLLGLTWAVAVPLLVRCSEKLHPDPASDDHYTCCR